MFQVGEIVLYRLLPAQVIKIKEGSDCHLYLLTSLESENCRYEVPANAHPMVLTAENNGR